MTEPKLGPDALLDAAAVLFDEHGIDAVSLSRINEASGHRNRSAVTYHFGGKPEVVRALVERSVRLPDAVRGALLDKVERDQRTDDPRAVLEALIAPLTQQLDSVEGRRHLRLLGQVTGHPQYLSATQNMAYATPNLTRCAIHLTQHLAHLPRPIQLERVAVLGAFIVRAYADQARVRDTEGLEREILDAERFTSNLLDLLVAMVLAPSSLGAEET